jgi:hypothetical protein
MVLQSVLAAHGSLSTDRLHAKAVWMGRIRSDERTDP